MSVAVLILSRFQKIRSFKIIFRTKPRSSHKPGLVKEDDHLFQGFYLGFKSAILYICVVGIAFFSAFLYKEKAENVEEQVVRVFTAICGFILLNEAQHKLPILRTKVCKSIRICDITSLLILASIEYVYIRFDEPWFVSDILTILLLGGCIKLFKITSLQDALYFYIPCVVLDVAISLYATFFIRYEWDSLVLKYFNTPLSAQIPYFVTIYKKKCGWISIVSILFPGFFMGYAFRFDKCKDILIYELISFLGLSIGLISWLSITSIYSLPLPVSLFTLLPMLAISSLMAFQRHDINAFWTGYFYDAILLDPHKKKQQLDGGDSPSSIKSINFNKTEQQPTYIEMNQLTEKVQLVNVDKEGKIQINDSIFDNLL